jgi:hypothetical protein
MVAEVVDCSNSKLCLNGKGMVESRLNSKLQFFWKYNFEHIPRFPFRLHCGFHIGNEKENTKPSWARSKGLIRIPTDTAEDEN